MGTNDVEFDQRVRAYVYDMVITQGTIPTRAMVAEGLKRLPGDVAAAFRRLAQDHVVVLQRESDEILMAAPFSAVPTAFQVDVDNRVYWGNCIWDALGILAMLKRDGRVRASCGDCGFAMTVTVSEGRVVDSAGTAHFSIPTKRWWDDIVFT